MMIALRLGLQIIVFVAVVVSLFIMTCTLKSSGVFTAADCVLYRKRRFFTSQSEGICFVVYHISKVKRVDGKEKQPAAIKGEINAAYVLRDGITIHSVKKLGKVSIPPCFTDMETILETLQKMTTETAEGEDPAAFDIKQSGLPI